MPSTNYKFRGKESRNNAWEEGKGFGIRGRDDVKTAFDWDDFSRRLPTGKDEASEQYRRKLWKNFDINGTWS